jgi:hypothetical protein
MATKKEKRAAGEARAAMQRKDSIESGLQAQKGDQEARQRQAMKAKLAAEKDKEKLKKTKQSLKMKAMAPDAISLTRVES